MITRLESSKKGIGWKHYVFGIFGGAYKIENKK